MDMIGARMPDLVGYSLGNQNASPPNLCMTLDLDTLPFGKLNWRWRPGGSFFFELNVSDPSFLSGFDLRFEGAFANWEQQLGNLD